jgi:hypothetical protein
MDTKNRTEQNCKKQCWMSDPLAAFGTNPVY